MAAVGREGAAVAGEGCSRRQVGGRQSLATPVLQPLSTHR
jgi:hypothetical protein